MCQSFLATGILVGRRYTTDNGIGVECALGDSRASVVDP
jgi:hypothetical protein